MKKSRQKSRHQSSRAVVHTHYPDTLLDPIRDAVQSGKPMANILRVARATDDPKIAAQYLAIAGCAGLADLLGSNIVESKNVAFDTENGLRREAATLGFQLAVQVQRIGKAPAHQIDLDIKTARRQVRDYKKAGVSSISAVSFEDLPTSEDPDEFEFELQLRTLLYGRNIEQPMQQLSKTFRKSALANEDQTTLSWIDCSDQAAICKAVSSVIAPPLVGGDESRTAAAERGIDSWMKNGLAAHRAWVKLQVYSMLPMKKRYWAQGQGLALLEPALRGALERYKQVNSETISPIPRDGLLHFWIDELRRLELHDQRLPLIRIR